MTAPPSPPLPTIGLLGGMSWESTATYYRILNEQARAHLGGVHSAELILRSVDFATYAHWQHEGDWSTIGTRLGREAAALERSGAAIVVLCTNTMHAVASDIEGALDRARFLHIADAVAGAAMDQGLETIGLLGTRFTMERPFYRDRLTEAAPVRVVVPDDDARGDVHRIIYEELCQGQVTDASRRRLRDVVAALVDGGVDGGVDGVVLGCTELGLALTDAAEVGVPLLDSTVLHATAAMDAALGLR